MVKELNRHHVIREGPSSIQEEMMFAIRRLVFIQFFQFFKQCKYISKHILLCDIFN